jgi:SAM-dependent methyltransferase
VSAPERIVPDETEPGIVALHLKRYEFARRYCTGADVLDAGCGVGYGTAFLAEQAGRVVGVDLSEQAIAYARGRYALANVEFVVGDVAALPLSDDSFDAVCAFETIEHLPEPVCFLREVKRVLRPGGVFVVSTPQVERTETAPVNPHHETEYSAADLERLLGSAFASVELYGQRRRQTGRHRLLQRLDVLGLRRRLPFLRGAGGVLTGTAPMAEVSSDEIEITTALEGATELIAVCR